MATVYKIELTSHWINYTETELKEIIKEAFANKRNEVTIKVNK